MKSLSVTVMKRIFTTTILATVAMFAFSASAQEYKDIFDYIRGKVPGVQVGQAGPGSMPSIIIRGIGTNSEHTQPLFIVDGVQTDNIATIDPNNVESIDIIKDGTASIYGMQGANGVIMVTTKSAADQARREAAARKALRELKKLDRRKAAK